MDLREEIIYKFQDELLENNLLDDMDKINSISNELLIILNNYEVQHRCTEIAVIDSTNEQILKRYAASLLIEGKSKKTIEQYIRTCNKVSDFLNTKPFTEVTSNDLKYYLAMELKKGISNVTLENQRAYLSAFFTWLETEEIIEKNPMKKIKPIKCNKEVKLPFSNVELDMMRSVCQNNKERAILEILISTGVRISELINLNIADIDFNTLTLYVRHGKGDKDRVTYFTEVAAAYLKKYLEERNDNNEALFISRNKARYHANSVRNILNKLGEKGSVENVHPHRFRRTFATNLAKRGMDIQDIKILMGHSDINTTLTYVYTDKTKVKSEYGKYSA